MPVAAREPPVPNNNALEGANSRADSASTQTETEESIAPIEGLANAVHRSLQDVKADILETETIDTRKKSKFK